MKSFIIILTLFLVTVGELAAQNDTTIRLPRDAWERYFENSSDPNHSAIDDHRNYHNMVIATDRPDQTETPYLVPRNRFQIETGAWMERDKQDTLNFDGNTLNTSLFKYGVTEHFELRLIAEYLDEKISHTASKREVSSQSGFNSIAIGSKIFLCEERKFIPKISLITHLQLPYFGDKAFQPNNIAPRFRFLFQHTLSDRFAFSYNLGSEWDGLSSNATLIYTASLGINLIPNMAMFLEVYGFMTENTNTLGKFNGTFAHDHRADAGFTYVITNDLQVDVSGGIGILDASPDFFGSCGISWRIPKLK